MKVEETQLLWEPAQQLAHSLSILLVIPDLVDHFAISEYLLPLNRRQMHHLGVALGLDHRKLRDMMHSDTFSDDVIYAWLLKEDQVQERGGPTWRNLVKVLKSPRMGQTGIANKIAKDKGF